MTITKRQLRIHLESPVGSPLGGAKVSLQLSAYQVDGTDVVPLAWDLVEDGAAVGDYVGLVWPNTRGDAGTHFDMLVQANGQVLLRQVITVPEGDGEAFVTARVNSPPWPALYEASAEVALARAHSEAAGESASLVLGAVGQAVESDQNRRDFEDRVYPGVYGSLPTTKPHSGLAPTDGDRCMALANGQVYEFVRRAGAWMIPNFDAQDLAVPGLVSAYGFDGPDMQGIMDAGVKLQGYAQLLSWAKRGTFIRITTPGIAGDFLYSPSAPNTTNWCTRFAHASGVGAWMRQFTGPVDVYWAGAKGDGVTDDTAAIHAAFAASYFVVAPYGAFKVTGLTVPPGVRFEGGGRTQTTIIIRAADKNTPMFRYGDRSFITKLACSYPDQVTAGAPVPYAPTFTHNNTSLSYSTVQDILLLGSYDAFDHTGVYNGGNLIDQIYGYPLHRFVKLDYTLDVTRITNFHLNPNVLPYADDTKAWVFTNGELFDFRRVDRATVSNFLTFGYGVSVRLNAGTPSGSANMITIQNGLFDAGRTHLVANSYQDGIKFTDVYFASVDDYAGVTNTSPGLSVLGSPVYPITFTSCYFRHFRLNIFDVAGAVKAVNCEFDNWNSIGGTANNAAIKTSASGAVVQVLGGTMNGRSNGLCRGISNDGTTDADITVIGTKFTGIADKDIFALAATLRVAQIAHSAGINWNGVPCEERNGGVSTYQTPSGFTLYGDFIAGTRFGNLTPGAGKPNGWVRADSGAAWVSEAGLS